MKRILPIWLLAIALVFLTSGQAAHAGSAPTPAATPVGAAQGFSGLGWIAKPMSPLVKEAGYRCRRDCDWCRKDCYGRFRVRCHGPDCRGEFTICMRYCWEDICRYC